MRQWAVTTTVALGDYNDDTHKLTSATCTLPPYMSVRPEGAKPYYIPLRALMVGGAPNLLVAGKLLAQSFHANSNTRLHPSEWTTGVAAGGTAALMVRRGWNSTAAALAQIGAVRAFLNSSHVGQPLEWAGLPTPEPPVSSTCASLGRCFSVDAAGAKAAAERGFATYNLTHGSAPRCEAACPPLAADEWLAAAALFTSNSSVGAAIYATQPTYLKKSTANSLWLDRATQLLRVSEGEPCFLLATQIFAGYWACRHAAPPPPPPLPPCDA